MLKRIGLWLVASVLVAVVVLACAAPKAAAPAPAPSRSEPATPGVSAPQSGLTREQKLIEAAKANKETEVVLWAQGWRPGPVEDAFHAKYPFLTLKVWDGSVRTEPRLLEEYKAGVYTPDVLSNNGLFRAVRMQNAGVFQEYEYPNVVNWPNQPSHRFWVNELGYFMAPAYNTKLVAAADAPKSWEDLANAKWRGKSVATDQASDWVLTYAYMLGDLTAQGVKWDRTVSFWKNVVKVTEPQVIGLRPAVEATVVGDASINLVASGGVVINSILQGAPIEFAPVKQVPQMPLALSLTKHPPHPNAAKLFLDFITSEEGNLVHASLTPSTAYHPQVVKKAYVNRYLASRGIELVEIPFSMWKPELTEQATAKWVNEILGKK